MKIAIASGKGGTGKTFVSTNIAKAISKAGRSVTLTDCDAEEPNDAAFFDAMPQKHIVVDHQIPAIDPERCTWCGRCAEWCEFHAILMVPNLKFSQVLTDICHGCGACSMACRDGAITTSPKKLGTITISQRDNLTLVEGLTEIGAMSPVPVIKAALNNSRHHHWLTLLDAPPGTACAFAVTVSYADYTILVTEPTPFGLSDLENSVEALRDLKKPFGVIVNRAGLGDRALYDYLEKEKIALLLEIPFNRLYALDYSNGRCAVDDDPALGKKLIAVVDKIVDTTWK